jgi:hypothetical protein
MKATIYIALLFLLIVTATRAQEKDLLSLVEEETPSKEFVKNAFKSSRVISSHSAAIQWNLLVQEFLISEFCIGLAG